MKRIVCILSLVLPMMAAAQAPADTTRPDPNKFIKVESQPIPVNYSEFTKCLKYPPEMVKDSITGKVLLKVLIDETGKPIEHIVLRSPNPKFIPTVADCLYNTLRFSPALVANKPIKFWTVVPVDFRL